MVGKVQQRSHFEALSATRHRGRSGPVWVSWVPGDDPPAAAYVVNKAVGTAVVRNRVRRRLREQLAGAERDEVLAPGRYLVGVRPAAATMTSAQLRQHLRRALHETVPR